MYLSIEGLTSNIVSALGTGCVGSKTPFPWVVADFPIPNKDVFRLSTEIDSITNWHVYDSPLEKKRTNCNWNEFGPGIYSFLTAMCSPVVTEAVAKLFDIDGLVADVGLHGGGVHVAGKGDKLNVHQDYAIHPKLGLRRVVNAIFYVEPKWSRLFGGGLEFWSGLDSPVQCCERVEALFNSMVLFRTDLGSWHGFPEPLTCPDGVLRKSLAMYYLAPVELSTPQRFRARYAPTVAQQGDPVVTQLIADRVSAGHRW